ncbi:MAG: YdcF family protein [Hydrogenophilales bacterium]|nr:YdcF family protein [Hydrogenophilales bacterium]
MFEVSKVVGWLFSPLVLTFAFLGAGLLFYWLSRPRFGLFLGLIGFAGLWALSMPWVAHKLVHQLEARFPALSVEQHPNADALVVLGGALAGASPPERPMFDLGSAADRVWFAAALYQAGKAPWIVVSGGNQPGSAGIQVEAVAIRSMLLTLGVPDSAIRMEGNSRNTAENAQESVNLIRGIGARRVLLVTSAMHMPRALRIFQADLREFGVTVLPASTDVEGLPGSLHWLGRWLPDANALALSSRVLKEYLGLVLVRVTK